MITRTLLAILLCTLLIAVPVGCGGGAGNGGSTGSGGGPGTLVTFTFDLAPTATAVKTGAGNFELASLKGTTLSVNVPSEDPNYSIAYVCPSYETTTNDFLVQEFVFQANIQDGTSFDFSCGGSFPVGTLSTLTGTLDTTAIPGANSVWIVGPGDQGPALAENNGQVVVNGPFSAIMPEGTSDLGVLVYDGERDAVLLAAKILHDQAVPGVLNGGNVITFQPSDEMTSQPLGINIPAGYSLGEVYVAFSTNSISFELDDLGYPRFSTQYLVMPPAAVQRGDYYVFDVGGYSSDFRQGERTEQSIKGGGPVTISLPAPYTYAGPPPAPLPTFTFDYPGFSNVLAQEGGIGWSLAGSTGIGYGIDVTATANFQNGANTIVILDIASLTGFLASPASGTNVGWATTIWGGSLQPFPANVILSFLPFGGSLPANGNSVSDVTVSGTYTVP